MKIEYTNFKEVKHLLKYHYLKTNPMFIKSVIKATINKKIVGCVVMCSAPRFLKCRKFTFKDINKDVVIIQRLIVIPTHRKKNIAFKMLKFALQSKDFKYIEVITRAFYLEKLFKRCGFITQRYFNSRNKERLYCFIFITRRCDKWNKQN